MTCDHPDCKCASDGVERDGRQYCSEECAAQDQDGESCECGHSDCA